MPDFLLEIGCEEIPARMLDDARVHLSSVHSLLVKERLISADHDTKDSFDSPSGVHGKLIADSLIQFSSHKASFTDESTSSSTPRRITFFCPAMLSTQPDVEEEIPGPATKVAYKDGKPTPAAEAFAKKVNLPVEKLEKRITPKGEYLFARVLKKGRSAIDVLYESLPKEITSIPWAKNMSWRIGKPERFARPVRWIVALFDGQVIPMEFGGIKAGNQSRGHRILGSQEISIQSPAQYAETMRGVNVVVSGIERLDLIRKALDAAARTVPSIRWREDAALLNTVVNLTEWPSVILGSFDKQ